MKITDGVTEHLKQHDQIAWVRAMNSIRNRAEGIILRETIYEEDAVREFWKKFDTETSSQLSMAQNPSMKRPGSYKFTYKKGFETSLL